MAQVVFDGLGRGVGGPGERAEGGHIDKGPAVEGAHVQPSARAAGGGLHRVRGQGEAGGEIVGTAAGDIAQRRRRVQAHGSPDRFVQRAVPAAADDAVEVRPLRLHDLSGVAGVGGAADGNQVARLAEMGHRVKERGRGAGPARPGVQDQQEGLCHSGFPPRVHNYVYYIPAAGR